MAASTTGQIRKLANEDDRKQQAKSYKAGEPKLIKQKQQAAARIEPFSDEALEGLLDKLELHGNLDQFSDLLRKLFILVILLVLLWLFEKSLIFILSGYKTVVFHITTFITFNWKL